MSRHKGISVGTRVTYYDGVTSVIAVLHKRRFYNFGTYLAGQEGNINCVFTSSTAYLSGSFDNRFR